MAGMTLIDFLLAGGAATKNQSLADQLSFVKQYDPNASIGQGTYDDTQGRFNPDVLNFDQRLLPKYADGTTYGQVNAQGHPINTPLLGASALTQSGVETLANPSDIWKDPNYGNVTHSSNININEKMNNAQQRTLLDTLGPLLVGGIAGFAGMPSILTMLMKQFSNPGGGPIAAISQLLQGQKQQPGG